MFKFEQKEIEKLTKELVNTVQFVAQLPVIRTLWLAMLWFWRFNDDPDPKTLTGKRIAVAMTSYAAREHEEALTHASKRTQAEAVFAAKMFNAPVFWGSFAPKRAEVEEGLKKTALANLVNHFVGKFTSTTDEADALIDAIKRMHPDVDIIIVVSDESHARRQRIVWRRKVHEILPNTTVLFRTIRAKEAADTDNPMFFQRYWETWLAFNIFFGLVYKIPPLLWLFEKLNFHQPVDKEEK